MALASCRSGLGTGGSFRRLSRPSFNHYSTTIRPPFDHVRPSLDRSLTAGSWLSLASVGSPFTVLEDGGGMPGPRLRARLPSPEEGGQNSAKLRQGRNLASQTPRIARRITVGRMARASGCWATMRRRARQ
jgi:hypothetical protein